MRTLNRVTSTPTWPGVLERLLQPADLSADQARWAMAEVMSGQAAPSQTAAFLTALRAKGVSGDELAQLVAVILDHAVSVTVGGTTVDTCGTGGDNSGSVNISTMAAIVTAACGRRVVKHGNRSASSQAGSADVLEQLGLAIDLAPDRIAECVDAAGIAFCFAPVFHPAMRHAGPVRREIGIRTVFNFLGPMANPAAPSAQVLGVADRSMAPIVAAAMARRGVAALVMRGEDGLDEITTFERTRIWDCRGGSVREVVIDTRELGVDRPAPGSLDGGDARRNAELARAALAGGAEPAIEAIRDAVAVNAAAALLMVDSASGAAPQEPAGDDLISQLIPYVAEARDAMATGAAEQTLERWVEVTRELAQQG